METEKTITKPSGVDNYKGFVEVLELTLRPDGPPNPAPKKGSVPSPPSQRPLPTVGFKKASLTALPTDKAQPETVGDIMTRTVIAIEPNSTLAPIEQGMRAYGFRHLPVVEPGNKLVGLVTHRDLMHAESSTLSADRQERDAFIMDKAQVAHIMQRDCLTASASDTIAAAATKMLRYKIGCLPVVDEDGILVGIITSTDMIKMALHLMNGAATAN